MDIFIGFEGSLRAIQAMRGLSQGSRSEPRDDLAPASSHPPSPSSSRAKPPQAVNGPGLGEDMLRLVEALSPRPELFGMAFQRLKVLQFKQPVPGAASRLLRPSQTKSSLKGFSSLA